jgi:acetate kinase
VRRATELVPGARRVVVAHLGGGAALCAALDGRSTSTTMGFTPLDGLVMATRCGSLDPGAVLWLRSRVDDLDDLLERRSGLLGLAGSDDLRQVRAKAAAGDADAALALEVWAHRATALLGASAASIGGIDVLVFTGGIGEHDAAARRAVAEGAAWLGVAVAEGEGGEDDRDVTAPGARVRTLVVAAREDLQLAEEAARVLRG